MTWLLVECRIDCPACGARRFELCPKGVCPERVDAYRDLLRARV